MTRIHGQIEPLKRIRTTLDQKGITRFNSTGQILNFLHNYDNEKETLFFNIEREFERELEALQTKALSLQQNHDELKTKIENHLNAISLQVKTKSEALSKPAKNALMEILNWYQQQLLLTYGFILKKAFKHIVRFITYPIKKQLESIQEKIKGYTINRQSLISERCEPHFQKLEHIKTACAELKPTIIGATGEYLVSTELEKLPDTCILINDFSYAFDKPIYNRKDNEVIRNIQIDHLLVTPGGIFVIETKYWSKASISSNQLSSPIKQVNRANYALYSLLQNHKSYKPLLKSHHWGKKKIPLRNIVAMIHHQPKHKFQFVAIKNYKELNGYISRFTALFDEREIKNIADYLIRLNT